VRLRTPVRRIVVEDGRAAGVELADGRVLHAPAVVSNADTRRTFLELVGASHLPAGFVRGVEGLAPSASACAVFLGLDTVPDVAPITIVSDGERHLAMNTPSLADPSLAPAGHASMTLVSLVPAREAATWDRRAPGYARRKRAAGDALVDLAERVVPGLRERIVYRQDASPPTFARYAWTTGGAIYGARSGAWRPAARSPIEGLVLAGAGVFPGAGVEAAVISGTLAADALCPAPGPAGRGCRPEGGAILLGGIAHLAPDPGGS
jgi:phytoene dehydrogenase-like protein